ncbi:hypothetical protein CIHG_00144 [Coccidioides immitis H538.4]|uniref:Uncharacterized protein n=1 Tax=Coccidioides immitis H538.4 TaxID=396776 RepID=A0A0J8RAY1_COCIT|nr:hypothetical protein CIHG_00144 [Coccidioides immitis H538.4]
MIPRPAWRQLLYHLTRPPLDIELVSEFSTISSPNARPTPSTSIEDMMIRFFPVLHEHGLKNPLLFPSSEGGTLCAR